MPPAVLEHILFICWKLFGLITMSEIFIIYLVLVSVYKLLCKSNSNLRFLGIYKL